MACLVITSGEQAGKYFQLAQRPLTAGRDPARDIQLLDSKVSRKHFQVRCHGDGYLIREMRSKNGVLINGARVEDEHKLADGDQIQAGDTTLVYYEQDDPDRTNALNQYKQAGRPFREDMTLPD